MRPPIRIDDILTLSAAEVDAKVNATHLPPAEAMRRVRLEKLAAAVDQADSVDDLKKLLKATLTLI